MSPKNKAQYIFEKFYYVTDEDGCHSSNKYRARLQAIICCDETIDYLKVNGFQLKYNTGKKLKTK